jgi:hypothetical protein
VPEVLEQVGHAWFSLNKKRERHENVSGGSDFFVVESSCTGGWEIGSSGESGGEAVGGNRAKLPGLERFELTGVGGLEA